MEDHRMSGTRIGNFPSFRVAILAGQHVTSWWIGRNWTIDWIVSNQPLSEKDRGLFRFRAANLIGLQQNTTTLSRSSGLMVWRKRKVHATSGTYHIDAACTSRLWSNRVTLPGMCWRDIKPAKRGEISNVSKIERRSADLRESLSWSFCTQSKNLRSTGICQTRWYIILWIV